MKLMEQAENYQGQRIFSTWPYTYIKKAQSKILRRPKLYFFVNPRFRKFECYLKT